MGTEVEGMFGHDRCEGRCQTSILSKSNATTIRSARAVNWLDRPFLAISG